MPYRPQMSSRSPKHSPHGKSRSKPHGRPGSHTGGKRGRRPSGKAARPHGRSDGRLELRNPHAALAAVERRPSDAVELVLAGEGGSAWSRVVDACEANAIRIRTPSPEETRSRDADRGDREGRKTGVWLVVEPVPAAKLNAMLTETKRDVPGLWLVLEQIQDPRNLGAIFRSAAFFGTRGVILTKDRSASLTAIACDTAAGGAEAVPHCVVTNLARSLAVARDEYGFRIVGASEHADCPVESLPRDVDTLLVLGNEEKGLRRLTREHCDTLAAIPATGGVGSLNVSVAAGVLLHALRPDG